MNQSMVSNTTMNDAKYSIISETPEDIESIKKENNYGTPLDDYYIKEEPLEVVDESNTNYEMKSLDSLKQESLYVEVCNIDATFFKHN